MNDQCSKSELKTDIGSARSAYRCREYYATARTTSRTPKAAIEPAPRLLVVNHDVNDFLQHRMELASTLQEYGFDVHVAVPFDSSLEEISCQRFPIHFFYLQRKSTRLSDEVRCCVTLLRLYQRLRPMLVHHIGLKPALYGGVAAQIASVPMVLNLFVGLGYLFTSRTMKMNVLRSIVSYVLRLSFRHQGQFAIFQNPDDRDCLFAGAVAPDDRARVIKGSGVDLSLFTPQPEPSGPPMVLMASRLLWQKGVGEFVAAARTLRASGICARFVLLGEPDLGHPSAIQLSTLERWRDAGDVEWLGWRNDMPALLAQSHLACLPSYYGEGVPRFLIEAAATGRAIVTTDSPGCREVVRHGQNGLLVPVRDVKSLVGAIAQLIENAPLRAAMGAQGRAIATREFSLEKVIDANLAVYHSLLASTNCIEAFPRIYGETITIKQDWSV